MEDLPITGQTLLMVGIGILVVIWLFGLVRRIGGCLINLVLLAAAGLALYGIATGQILLPF
jgi:hypothetical protein